MADRQLMRQLASHGTTRSPRTAIGRAAWLMLLFIAMLMPGGATGAEPMKAVGDTITFRFRPGRRMFYSPFEGNEMSIAEAARMIEQNREAIRLGRMKVRVKGYCTSYPTLTENLAAAKNRSRQVKSYFITHSGLIEDNFITTNHTFGFRGNGDIVALAYLEEIAAETEPQPQPCEPEPIATIMPVEEVLEPEDVDAVQPMQSTENRISEWFVGTNVAYLAAGVSNLSAEWAFRCHWSVELPLIYSPYTISRTYRMRFLYIQPEARLWLDRPGKGHFFGVHAHAGVFNVAVNRSWRYQSEKGFYGGGLSYGYSLPLGVHWIAQFEAAVGYTFTRYCKYYNVHNGMRVEKDVPYNYWGLTRIGVSVVYTFGDRKEVGAR